MESFVSFYHTIRRTYNWQSNAYRKQLHILKCRILLQMTGKYQSIGIGKWEPLVEDLLDKTNVRLQGERGHLVELQQLSVQGRHALANNSIRHLIIHRSRSDSPPLIQLYRRSGIQFLSSKLDRNPRYDDYIRLACTAVSSVKNVNEWIGDEALEVERTLDLPLNWTISSLFHVGVMRGRLLGGEGEINRERERERLWEGTLHFISAKMMREIQVKYQLLCRNFIS